MATQQFNPMELIYHEKQIGRMCAQHALNMLLQGKFFSIDSLVEIAQDLDLRERAVLDDSASNQFQSQNYDDSGYFSLQVITEALRRQANLHLEPLHSPHLLHIRESPSLAQAYICHYDDHWFAIRKIGITWFVLNSLLPSPRVYSEWSLELYITQLHADGWSLFVVDGELPSCAAESVPDEFWVELRGTQTQKCDNDLEKAIALSLKVDPSASPPRQNNSPRPWIGNNVHQIPINDQQDLPKPTSITPTREEEHELQKALEESLWEVNRRNVIRSTESALVEEAMRRSIAEQQNGQSSSNYMN